MEELDGLTARGIDVSKLVVSSHAHIITAYHRTLESRHGEVLGQTPNRNHGPRHSVPPTPTKSTVWGSAFRIFFDEGILRQKVEGALESKNHLLVKIYNRRAIGVDEVCRRTSLVCRPVASHGSGHGAAPSHRALEEGKTVLCEGGQATMLDVDHGTYPFVTSSNATSGGASTGTGIAPWRLDKIIGIVKGLHNPCGVRSVSDRA